MTPPRRTLVLRLVAAAAAALGLLVAIEGLSSVALLVADLARGPGPRAAERRHTVHDPDLGWANEPGRVVRDMYGPGKTVTIDAQGFRGAGGHAGPPAPGRARVVCSGDSFTFGYGVDDASTWCELLSGLPGRPETVNMGQGGYGIDQSFLWFVRDGQALRPDVHLFAFIRDDLDRALSDEFLGYPKPLLALRNGRLEVTNVPVPRTLSSVWMGDALRRLRTSELARRIAPEAPRPGAVDLPTVVPSIFADLAALHQEHGSAVVFVYLPTADELRPREGDAVREWLRQLCAMRGWTLVDLTEDLRRLPPSRALGLFIPEGAMPEYLHAAHHYNEEGHRFVAAALGERLLALPAVRAKLAPERAAPAGETRAAPR